MGLETARLVQLYSRTFLVIDKGLGGLNLYSTLVSNCLCEASFFFLLMHYICQHRRGMHTHGRWVRAQTCQCDINEKMYGGTWKSCLRTIWLFLPQKKPKHSFPQKHFGPHGAVKRPCWVMSGLCPSGYVFSLHKEYFRCSRLFHYWKNGFNCSLNIYNYIERLTFLIGNTTDLF